ncbi:MAG: hypothetical protein Q9174_001584 [Haloplaca sp. 1 TL-2023]
MSLRVLLCESPRSLVLASEHYALVFRGGPSNLLASVDGASDALHYPSALRCVVQFSMLKSLDLSAYRSVQASGVLGTLGLINVDSDVFLCVISAATRVATVRPEEHVQKILSVDFCSSFAPAIRYNYPKLTERRLSEQRDYDSTDANPYNRGSDSRETGLNHPCFELKKILSGGTFYYSVNFDLTNRLQDRLSEGSAFDIDSLDKDFLWNAYMIDPLIEFRSKLSAEEKSLLDESRILTSAIRGFVVTTTISAASSPLKSLRSNQPSNLTVISRLSCRRAGTRFNSRGIDDDGFVANFVESETVLWHPSGLCFSYAQVRGSIPIFWEQTTGLLPNQQKIQIIRSPEATQPAFDRHFERLELSYGTVHVLNLMSAHKPGEVELTTRYQYHIQRSPLNQALDMDNTSEHRLLQSQFDFHAETKGSGGYEAASLVRRLIQDRADSFAYLLCGAVERQPTPAHQLQEPSQQESTVILEQEGVFRTNCLDCLDRTNLIQTIISQMAIELFLNHHSERATADFWMRHSTIWADNGDALSKIYAGTGALKSSFTRHGKMSLAGAIADARKSATRLYINNFADQGRQNTVDILLGRLVGQSLPVHLYDPINDYVTSELRARNHEFSTTEAIYIWAGTFNLNGKEGGAREDLSPWLHPQLTKQKRNPEIVAVGFQEIVELSPQQIMSTDPVRRQLWEEAVRRTINRWAKDSEQDDYVLLRSGQLVGAALIVFVKSSALKMIKNVEGSVKKTGMSGMAGNKGAVAIRMDYANTRICLVTAHLAAGFANYEERNRDYRTISHGLRFQRNRSIDDHDTIIWLGDFNYRIGLSDDKVRRLIQAHDLGTLYQNDQLNLQMIAGRVFPYYSEAQVTFAPTYKYDNGTDEYDSSEKARIPAWCDRILRKGNNLKQIEYTTAALRFSDHRPVYATFQCTVSRIDEQRKEALSDFLYKQRKSAVTTSPGSSKKTDEDVVGYKSIAEGLPPASSNRRKWWLDNSMDFKKPTVDEVDSLTPTVDLPVRSQVQPPQSKVALNPARPLNPFSPTREPDWVMVAEAEESELPGRRSSAPRLPPCRGEGRRPARSQLEYPESPRAPLAPTSARALEIPATPASLLSPAVEPNLRRKPAPPVPRKPAVLSISNAGPGHHGRHMLDAYSEQGASIDSTRPPLPLCQQSGLSTTNTPISQPISPENVAVSKGQQPSEAKPSSDLSSRMDGDRSDQPSDSLLDDAIEDGGMIPSLKPSQLG